MSDTPVKKLYIGGKIDATLSSTLSAQLSLTDKGDITTCDGIVIDALYAGAKQFISTQLPAILQLELPLFIANGTEDIMKHISEVGKLPGQGYWGTGFYVLHYKKSKSSLAFKHIADFQIIPFVSHKSISSKMSYRICSIFCEIPKMLRFHWDRLLSFFEKEDINKETEALPVTKFNATVLATINSHLRDSVIAADLPNLIPPVGTKGFWHVSFSGQNSGVCNPPPTGSRTNSPPQTITLVVDYDAYMYQDISGNNTLIIVRRGSTIPDTVVSDYNNCFWYHAKSEGWTKCTNGAATVKQLSPSNVTQPGITVQVPVIVSEQIIINVNGSDTLFQPTENESYTLADWGVISDFTSTSTHFRINQLSPYLDDLSPDVLNFVPNSDQNGFVMAQFPPQSLQSIQYISAELWNVGQNQQASFSFDSDCGPIAAWTSGSNGDTRNVDFAGIWIPTLGYTFNFSN